jgi:large subunit ribosomal protein L17
MRHRKQQTTRLGRGMGARQALLRSVAASLVLHERIRTTAARARAVRPFVERCITLSRTNGIPARRTLLATLGHQRAVRKLLEVVGPRYRTRAGGYTRTIPLGNRKGDHAPEVLLELVS